MKISNRKAAVVGVMSALSAILMFLEFPIGIVPAFIKLDFSELPALFTAFYAGPFWGAVVCLVKNLINLPFTSTACVGELANFVLGCFFVVPAGLIYKYFAHDKKGAIIGCAVGSLSMALLSIPLNYFLTFPFYAELFKMGIDNVVAAFGKIYPFVDSLLKAVVMIMVPFTLLKALAVSLITVGVYKRVSKFLNR